MTARLSIRCWNCRLMQFVGAKCRRCHKPLAIGVYPNNAEAAPVPMPSIRFNTAARVKECRKRKNLTQCALADLMGVPRTYISKVETGGAEPTMETRFRLAKALGVDVSELLMTDRDVQVRDLLADPFMRAIHEAIAGMSKSDLLVLEREIEKFTAST